MAFNYNNDIATAEQEELIFYVLALLRLRVTWHAAARRQLQSARGQCQDYSIASIATATLDTALAQSRSDDLAEQWAYVLSGGQQMHRQRAVAFIMRMMRRAIRFTRDQQARQQFLLFTGDEVQQAFKMVRYAKRELLSGRGHRLSCLMPMSWWLDSAAGFWAALTIPWNVLLVCVGGGNER